MSSYGFDPVAYRAHCKRKYPESVATFIRSKRPRVTRTYPGLLRSGLSATKELARIPAHIRNGPAGNDQRYHIKMMSTLFDRKIDFESAGSVETPQVKAGLSATIFEFDFNGSFDIWFEEEIVGSVVRFAGIDFQWLES